MDFDWQTQGHKKQLEFLDNAINRGKLAHAYVFAGPAGVGKKAIARSLAKRILQTEGSNFNADYTEITGEGSIKIEQIRDLIYTLSLKPYAAKYKVAVIEPAEQMTMEAANALLKALEEPKSYTVIILITANPTRLPKTILSRAQKITFGPLSEKPEQEDPETVKYFEMFKSKDLVDRLVGVQELANLETAEIKNILHSWLVGLRLELRAKASMDLAKKISEVAKAVKYLDQNVNSKLLLTNLMLNTSN